MTRRRAVWLQLYRKLAQASERRLWFDLTAVAIPPLAAQVCRAFGLNPLGAISSGALLFTASKRTAGEIRRALESNGIVCAEIGAVERARLVQFTD